MVIKTRLVDVVINGSDGSVVFEKKGFEVPEFYSDRAATIIASKYAQPYENSALQIFDRVAEKIIQWGTKDGYFNAVEASGFKEKLLDLMVNQRAAFNSPVYFNFGVPNNKQQGPACFLGKVEDTLEDIFAHVTRAAEVFRSGSGIGVNVSDIRAEGESLSNSGNASGPLSWMRTWDRAASSVKSGGRNRRAAVLIRMDADHPDIEKFLVCKSQEEKKAQILMDNGYSYEEAYATVDFQNANHSIGVSDDFMDRVIRDKDWALFNRGNKKASKVLNAKDLFKNICQRAWESGDPGLQFDDTINRFNPTPAHGRILTSNPCQPSWATVLTPEGIKTFSDIDVGSVIWSGKQWTKVVRKGPTGVKPVNQYITTSGSFVGTDKHRVFENGERVEVGEAEAIDSSRGPEVKSNEALNLSAVVDGWVFGDGSVHKASNNLVYLNLGKDDVAVFMSGYSDFHIEHRPGLKEYAHVVKTSIKAEDLGVTYNREVPNRFLTGGQSVVCGFLRGLYNANGSVCGGRVTLKASSFRVIQDVQQMLSSLGVRSYFTTNKKHDVEFNNGVYECKESYDLNITSDRYLFASLIGFDHPSKRERLSKALEIKSRVNNFKKTFEIIKVMELGEHPVWDITVEAEEHSYWTGGVLVSNCGEIYNISFSACNLCAINIMKYFDGEEINETALTGDISTIVTAMDIIVGNSDYPTKDFERVAKAVRPLGLGLTNVGAYLVRKGLPYGSPEACGHIRELMKSITYRATNASIQLAKKFGPFGYFEENKSETARVMSDVCAHSDWMWGSLVKEDILEFGVRNSQVTTAQPGGTVSYLLDADSTGVEPIYALTTYKNLVGGGTITMVPDVVIEKLAEWGVKYNSATDSIEDIIQRLPKNKQEVFWTANEIPAERHIAMTAAVQSGISGGVSKTINLPNDATVEDVEKAYMMAWQKGIKGITVYRDGSKMWQPLTSKKATEEKSADDIKIELPTVEKIVPLRRKLPDTRQSINHKFNVSGLEGYITAGLYDDGSLGEVLVRASKTGSLIQGLLDSFSIAISMAIQYGVPMDKLVDKFTNTRFDPAGFTTNPDVRVCTSVIDYIFKWLKFQFGEDDFAEIDKEYEEAIKVPVQTLTNSYEVVCPTCGSGSSMVRTGTCWACSNCGGGVGMCGG